MLAQLRKEMEGLADPRKAAELQRFFKTGKGEYGEGDIFLGIMVPQSRQLAKKHVALSLDDVSTLLKSVVHEHRLVALLLLVEKFQKADEGGRKQLYQFYLRHTDFVNNWDLVDLTAPKIVGAYLLDKDRRQLYTLARSTSLWERRIAIVATAAFIAQNDFEDTLKIAELLLQDTHDLIHKAVGWMLREVGKRDQAAEESFLERHGAEMPRTMLRYAIERFDEEKKKHHMKK